MASNGQFDLSSPFDRLLEEGRKQLDGLYSGSAIPEGGGDGPRRADVVKPPPRSAALEGPKVATPSAGKPRLNAAPQFNGKPSEARQFLSDRFGDRWRYEIVNRIREDDEAMVRCRLVIEDEGISLSQFGWAPIEGAGGATEITGSAGGVEFSARAGTPPSEAPMEALTEAAFRSATDAALAKCAAML